MKHFEKIFPYVSATSLSPHVSNPNGPRHWRAQKCNAPNYLVERVEIAASVFYERSVMITSLSL
jgi:hypothetical protein